MRALLGRLLGLGEPPPLRPPGARSEAALRARCIRCTRCAQVCPVGAIRLAPTPRVDPLASPCILCMRCPEACPTGALRPLAREAVSMGRALLATETCLSHQGTLCNLCFERCPLKGVALRLDDLLRPEVQAACVGCGVCAHVCPSQPRSIRILPAGGAP